VLRIDGLKRVPGSSRAGNYHYIPILFHGAPSVRKEQRALLEIAAHFLGKLQGAFPRNAVIYCGKECRVSTIRLSAELTVGRKLLRHLESPRATTSPPRLALGDRCPSCEFRSDCRQQAMSEDNLSLLKGVGEKEIAAYARKGILAAYPVCHGFCSDQDVRTGMAGLLEGAAEANDMVRRG
jgi:predicted RecB family nuclease